MSALKPCPFCGSADKPVVGPFHANAVGLQDGYEVVCDASGDSEMIGRGCGTSTGWSRTEGEAVERWNRRPEPSAPSPAGVEMERWDIETTAERIAREHSQYKGGRIHANWYGSAKAAAVEALTCARNKRDEEIATLTASLDQATRRAEEERRLRDEWQAMATEFKGLTAEWERRCSALEQALEDEREACAKIAETLPFTAEHHPTRIAKAIRAREALSSTARSITEKETDRG